MRSRITHIALAAELQAPRNYLPAALRKHLPALQARLADSIDRYVREKDMGYYPALSYFQRHAEVDRDALETLLKVTREAERYLRQLALARLSAPFPRVHCDHSLPIALSLPRVLPAHANAVEMLRAHYTPDVVRLHFVTHIRVKAGECCMAAHARQRAYRWLNGCCCAQITQSRSLHENPRQ